MELPAPDEIVKHPEFIRYLLSPDTPLDFHINVGNTNAATPEKLGQIKVVKWMLIAHSKVLRVMLLESEMRPMKCFNITDIKQNTFKNFLVFVYGHDDTTNLPFDDAVDLLSLAEKYDVAALKGKLALSLKSQVSSENVVTILKYGPVCETVPDLWAKATDVIQTETAAVFSHPEFKTLCPEAVVHILQQDALSVGEIDVWRASLAWARHQLKKSEADPSPGDTREILQPLLLHTRLCTVPLLDISKEVAPTMILTAEELQHIMISIGKQEQSHHLPFVCRDIQVRAKLSGRKIASLSRSQLVQVNGFSRSQMEIAVKPGRDIFLYDVVIASNNASIHECMWESYNCAGKISIFRLPPGPNHSKENVRIFDMPFDLQVPFSLKYCKITLKETSGNQPVLKANVRYGLDINFTDNPSLWCFGHAEKFKDNDDFRIVIAQQNNMPNQLFINHIGGLVYREKAC